MLVGALDCTGADVGACRVPEPPEPLLELLEPLLDPAEPLLELPEPLEEPEPLGL